MKHKKILFATLGLLIIVLIVISIVILNNKSKKFYLEDKYYQNSNMIDINYSKLEKLTNKKESFVVFIYQSMCVTSSNFENILSSFITENNITIYKMPFSDISDTKLENTIKYYPSFLIYKEGKLIDYLEADKDEDTNYYIKKEDFASWFNKYIDYKKVKKKELVKNDNEIKEEEKEEPEELSVDINNLDIKKEDGKVNIYFFWGNGCPHCKDEFSFLESIKNEYGKYFTIYEFETWKNEENNKLSQIFADAIGKKKTGVPYTIIGNTALSGFGESTKEEIINAIMANKDSNFDIYFDKIKQ